MKNKSLLATTVLAGLTSLNGFAAAADLPARYSAPPVFAQAPIITWTGFYAGVNAGYAFDYSSKFTTNYTRSGARVGVNRVNDGGFTGGGQVGYNYQLGGFGGGGVVVGLEADAAYTGVGRTRVRGLANGSVGAFNSSLDYLGTVRGRVGYAFNTVMVYGTGGLAYGNVNHSVNVLGNGSSYYGSSSDTKAGYAIGGGVEYALPNRSFLNFFQASAITVKAEYLYYDLGSTSLRASNQDLTAAGTDSYNSRVKTDGSLARIGLNYKF